MMSKYLPEFAQEDSEQLLKALLSSLSYLMTEATREKQHFVAYAIEDALFQIENVRQSKFTLKTAVNV